ncbi:MAG: lysostaphin resistance A-like protein [Lachnotalea sp.]
MKKEKFFMKIWRILYPVGIYFLISNIISVVYVMISGMLMQTKAIANGQAINMVTFQEDIMTLLYKNSMMLTAIAAATTIPIAYLIFRNDNKKENKKFEKCDSTLYGLIIIVAGVACLAGNQLLTISRLDEIFPGYQEVQQALYGGNIIMEVLAAVILAPIIEEILFRGIVFKRLNLHTGKIPAMILSSLFFGIYHGNVVQGVYAFTIGMLFVFIYDRYKTILAPIAAHMFANFISIISSETSIFDFLYRTYLNFYISTAIEVIASLLLIIIIYKKVFRSEIINEEAYLETNDKIIAAELSQDNRLD